MPKSSGFEYMINFVQDYLNGKTDSPGWDLDFNHCLNHHYPKMKRESRDLAECFNFYLAEEGFDQGIGLNDNEHKKLIRKQLREFKATMRDGLL